MSALQQLFAQVQSLQKAVIRGAALPLPQAEVAPTFLAYCVGEQGMSLADAYMLGKLHLPNFMPTPAILQRVIDLYQLPYLPSQIYDPCFAHDLLHQSNDAIASVQDGLYISRISAMYMPDKVAALGVRAVLRLDYEADQWRDDFTVLHMPIPDGSVLDPQVIRKGVRFIASHLRRGEGVLVHCHAGISRSAALILAYLLEWQGMSLPNAYHQVLLRRPVIAPHPCLLESLAQYYRLPAWELAQTQVPSFVRLLQTPGFREPIPDWAADTLPHPAIWLS